MRRLALCLAVAIAAFVTASPALADGPVFVAQGGAGVASHDGAFHYVTVPNGTHGTLLEKIDVAQGQVYWWMQLSGSWGTALIGSGRTSGQGLSRDGRTLVLADTAGPYASPSRFLLVDPRHAKVLRTITLPGSFTFDAISPDASRMYLIQYVHAASNDLTHYVVRGYDLRKHWLMPGRIADRSEDAEKTMAGYALTRTTSAGGRWVYTLYQKPSGEPFVHALDTVGASSYCIDLPQNESPYNLVLSLDKGGRTLAVHWLSGRPWLSVAVGSWRISYPGGAFPWAWVAGGAGGGLALLATGALLLLRGRRGEKVQERPREELGLA